MAKANTFWRRLTSRKQSEKGRIKNRRLPLDFETLENRYGPTPGIELGLSVMGFSFGNPLSIGGSADSSQISAVSDSASSSMPLALDIAAHELWAPKVLLPEGSRATPEEPANKAPEAPPRSHPLTGLNRTEFVSHPYEDLADNDQLFFLPSRPTPPGGASPGPDQAMGGSGGGFSEGRASPPPSSMADGPGGSQIPQFQGPGGGAPSNNPIAQLPTDATGLPQPASTTVDSTGAASGNSSKSAAPMVPPNGSPNGGFIEPFDIGGFDGGFEPMGLVGVTTDVASLYVIDNDKGMVLTSNVPVNDFSTYHVQLDAQLAQQDLIPIGETPFGTPSYTWNMTGAPDATSVTGASTYRLDFTWGSFSGAMRTQTIALSVTDGTNTIGQTFTFNVASTSSPAYNATQPTTTGSWPGFLKPDSVSSQQKMVGDSPYYQLGLTDGQVQLNHVLPSYNPNVAPLQLLYVSTAAVPEPIFVAQYQISTTDTTPGILNAQLTFNGTTGTNEQVGASLYFPGDKMQIALQGGATGLSTGRYPYTFRVTDANATPVTTTYSGSVNVLNYGSSAFGSWGLAGIERVYSVTGGVLLDLGDGTSLWFASSGSGTFTTPAGDFSTLTQNTSTSVYLRTMPDGTKYEFNSSGYQTAVKDRNLNTTTYSYDGSSKLTAIKDFNNQIVTLAYNGTRVSSITDPANRITTLTYNGSNLLTTIKDPDASLWTYTYTGDNTPNNFTTPTGDTTGFTYHSSNRAHGASRPGSSGETITPSQQRGLVGGVTGFATTTAGLLVAAAQADSADANGNKTDWFFDWSGFGGDTVSVDALNNTRITNRDTNGLLWLASDALANPTRVLYNSSASPTKIVQADASTMQFTYNSFNQISQTTDGLGNLSTASYDANGNMTQTKDALGALSTYTYTSQGMVSTTKDPRGNVMTYSYNTLNQLTQVKDSLNNLTTSLYDSAGNLTTSMDQFGSRITYSYDLKGRQTQTQDATGALTTSLYDLSGNQTTSIDARGNRTTYSFDGNQRLTQTRDALGNLTTSLFDKTGNLTTSIDGRSNRTTFAYDAANRQTKVQDALSNLSTSVYDKAGNVTTSLDANGRRTTYSYDVNNRQTQVRDALGNLSTSVFDAAGNMTTSIDARSNRTTFSFDATNRQTQVRDALGGLTTSVFDNAGNMTTTIDALSRRTTYSFDQLNRQTQMQDATGALTTSIFDIAGNQTTSIDARTNRTTYSFDVLNRQTQVRDALGNLTTSVYDSAGNMTTSIDGLSNRTTFAYDFLNRQTSVKDANSNVVTTMFDTAGNATTSIDASGARTTYSFDTLNRQTSVKDAGLGVTTTVYDKVGNVTNSIDGVGNKTTYVYDAINRRTTVIDPLGNRTTTAFDAVGNTTNVIDPVANKTTFVFDTLNRQTSMTDPLGNTGTMAYDAAGRLTSSRDRNTRVTSYSYDNVGRKTGETWVVSGSTVNTFTYTFDIAGNVLTAANSAGTYTMAYDTLNRVTNAKEPFSLALTYAYDKAGRQTTTIDSFGGTLTSVYDGVGNLTSRQFGGVSQTPLREDQTFNSRNQVATQTRYSDLAGSTLVGTSAYSYDSPGRVTNIQHAGKTGTILANYTYTYDLANRMTSKQDNGTSTAYGYDATSQLTSAGASAYSYDANGNRTMVGYSTGTNNQLLNDGTWTYTYDAEGNMTKKSKGAAAETWVYSYDNKNHMTGAKQQATDGGTLQMQATYAYDALSNRVEKGVWTSATGVQTTRFGYDGQNVWVDVNGSNTLQMRRMFLDGVDQVFARVDSSGNAAWYLSDHLGSIREVINSANTTTDIIAYDAFGGINTESNPPYGDRYMYTGRELDSETGLQYNRARNYNSAIGRWIEQDPIGFAAFDGNLYRYVSNNVPNLIDPDGRLAAAARPILSVFWTIPDSAARNNCQFGLIIVFATPKDAKARAIFKQAHTFEVKVREYVKITDAKTKNVWFFAEDADWIDDVGFNIGSFDDPEPGFAAYGKRFKEIGDILKQNPLVATDQPGPKIAKLKAKLAAANAPKANGKGIFPPGSEIEFRFAQRYTLKDIKGNVVAVVPDHVGKWFASVGEDGFTKITSSEGFGTNERPIWGSDDKPDKKNAPGVP